MFSKFFAESPVWKAAAVIVLLAASCLSVHVGAAWAATWQAFANPYPEASGSESDPIVISTPRQLAHLALQVSEGDSFEGRFIELRNDISISGRLWTPIGNRTEDGVPFNGRFDGKGHTIKGLTVRGSGESYHGLFGALGSNAVVCDLNLTGINVTADGKSLGVAGLAGYNAGRVENITSSGTVKGSQSVGGLVGRNFGSVLNIRSTVRVIGSGMYVGGLVGYNDFKKGLLSGMEMNR
jgi:hypothetical protein